MSGNPFSCWLGYRVATLQCGKAEKILGPHPAPKLFNLNTSTNSGSWSHKFPLQLMVIWPTMPTYGKGWQRPQSRHCGNATHLLDACCSSLCYELLKLPDQCTPSKPRNRSRGALLSSRALLRDTQLSRRKNDENRCEEPLHHAPSHGVSGIRRCAHHVEC